MQTEYHFMVSTVKGDLTNADDFNADVYCLTSWWLLSERNLILKAARKLMEAVVLTVISVFLESESLLQVNQCVTPFWLMSKRNLILKAARNLMEAVVLTVKASYVASRMFNNHKQQVHLDLAF